MKASIKEEAHKFCYRVPGIPVTNNAKYEGYLEGAHTAIAESAKWIKENIGALEATEFLKDMEEA